MHWSYTVDCTCSVSERRLSQIHHKLSTMRILVLWSSNSSRRWHGFRLRCLVGRHFLSYLMVDPGADGSDCQVSRGCVEVGNNCPITLYVYDSFLMHTVGRYYWGQPSGFEWPSLPAHILRHGIDAHAMFVSMRSLLLLCPHESATPLLSHLHPLPHDRVVVLLTSLHCTVREICVMICILLLIA